MVGLTRQAQEEGSRATNPRLPGNCLRCGSYNLIDGRTPDECACEDCGVRMAWADEPGAYGWIIP
ncbi:MAG: hypothetical protein Q8R28_11315 [Dehalococcoidia bacterium]|nr:hypothetical protein [Dehalococcoidia bacterium]